MSLAQPPTPRAPGREPPAAPIPAGPLTALLRRQEEFVDALGIRAGTVPSARALREHVREPHDLG
ncbi:hypothetical protein [Streptomyces sp. URMC 129]|uniref:hypothetical protein n=1 Tax=Streptomyces sp. URMC 129 TaxID=3423407 RepID=UPI003F1C4CB2